MRDGSGKEATRGGWCRRYGGVVFAVLATRTGRAAVRGRSSPRAAPYQRVNAVHRGTHADGGSGSDGSDSGSPRQVRRSGRWRALAGKHAVQQVFRRHGTSCAVWVKGSRQRVVGCVIRAVKVVAVAVVVTVASSLDSGTGDRGVQQRLTTATTATSTAATLNPQPWDDGFMAKGSHGGRGTPAIQRVVCTSG